jgi:UPF0755 protein
MRSGRRILWGGVSAFGLLLAFAFTVALSLYVLPSSTPCPDVSVHIPVGSTVPQIAVELRERGLLRWPWQLELVARLEGAGRRIRAGDYEMPAGSTPVEILRHLVEGKVLTVSVTLPEGWTLRRMIGALADSLHLDADTLRTLAAEPPPTLRELAGLRPGQSLEGYLFPETYRFARRLQESEVLGELIRSLVAALDDSMKSRMRSLGLDLHQTLTLASIVEAEATLEGERTRIAAVYHNRLREGWRLEADPTVAFALDKVGQPLSLRDLQVDSPYNTYKTGGLPPGPINNPGLGSIRAVLWPEPEFDAMYFVADGRGGHRFSRTWEQHRRAVEEYRRTRRGETPR